jgi:hypothetical protein
MTKAYAKLKVASQHQNGLKQINFLKLLKILEMTKKKKETRGGKRPFSGRKKADYETKTIAFRVRVEFVEPIKKMVKDYVSIGVGRWDKYFEVMA